MKFTVIRTSAAALLCGMLALASCSNADKKDDSASKSGKKSEVAEANLANYRYVDLDSLLDGYNLAKDYNEEMLRMQNDFENSVRQKETNLQSYANKVQQKYQNNSYLSSSDQQAIQQEGKKIQNMKSQAEKEIATLENNLQTARIKAQQTIRDSIQTFMKSYAQKHGYEVILDKNATLYINPDLDITNEVLEGLNARYNKVKK